jgi:D-hydroxyproline dehydrogenase subunit alpha
MTGSIEKKDLVIVGGGPAGMAAAIEARRAGVKSVCILDEGISLGGQVYRRFGPGFTVSDQHDVGHEFRDGQTLIDETLASGADIRTSTVVWGIWDKRIAYVRDDVHAGTIEAGAIIIATGARDRPVAIPGWTLPGVITAGAAKTMVAIQRVLPGRRILMAGSGPLALAFSAQLQALGANIVEVAEAAPAPGPLSLARLAVEGDRQTMMDAARFRAKLMISRVPFSYSTIVVRVEGESEVQRAVVARVDREWRVLPGSERTIEVDTVVLGYGLESSSELSRLIGCKLRYDHQRGGWIPERDAELRTSVPGVFAAGDGSGVGGAKHAEAEGRVAGIAAAGDLGALGSAEVRSRIAALRARLTRMDRFLTTLNQLYLVGPGLFELATDETVICRCEERTVADLDALISDGVRDPNIVRALSRIGMGRCQGRNCASNVAAAIARRSNCPCELVAPLSVRPPVKPVPVAALAEERHQGQSETVTS